MTRAPQVTLLPDGRRLHLHHGPIDLVIEVFGVPHQAPFERAAARFETLLEGLVRDLPALRRPLDGTRFQDPVARRMACAVALYGDQFVTPMAAVAGSVADEVLAAMVADEDIPKAYVNNGGDIAYHLAPDQIVTAIGPTGSITISGKDAARGMATSGWGGRSHSLGIADAVTVAANTAAAADVAATLIANAVDLQDHPAIERSPARDISPDSDLGARLVTTDVAPLSDADQARAVANGRRAALRFQARKLIHGAAIHLQNTIETTFSVPLYAPNKETLSHA